jgi:tetratricopeptide (TPR) repeat protein
MTHESNSTPLRAFLWLSSALLLTALIVVLANMALLDAIRHARMTDPRPHLAQAHSYIQQGEYKKALQEAAIAEGLAPWDPVPYRAAGIVHTRTGRWNDAVVSFRQAIARGDTEVVTHKGLLWCLVQLDRLEEATQVGEAAVAQGLTDVSLIEALAEAYRRKGDLKRAAQYFEIVLEIKAGDAVVLHRLLETYRQMGSKKDIERVEKRLEELELSQGLDMFSALEP